MKKARARGKWISESLADRPLPRWSEMEAARARQDPRLVVGAPPVLNVDGSDPLSVRSALDEEPFGHLISDETIEKLCREGRGWELLPKDYPVWRYGIDEVTYPCMLLAPTIEELESLEDKEQLAWIIRDLDIRGTTPRIQRLIKSTVEPDWTWIGETVQDHLQVDEE